MGLLRNFLKRRLWKVGKQNTYFCTCITSGYKVTVVSTRSNEQADFKYAGLLVIHDTNFWMRSKGLFIILYASTTCFIYSINYLLFTFFSLPKYTCILLLFIYAKFLYKCNFDSACWLLKSRNPRYEWWIVLSSHLSILDAFYFVSFFSPFGNTFFFGYIIVVEKCCISNFE